MKSKINVFWFRRDLRLDDNAGFYSALCGVDNVLPIFIFDTNILSELPKDDARVTFIYELLVAINAGLKKHGSSLAVFHDEPTAVFAELIKTYDIGAVFTNRDYEPYATKRDADIAKMLGEHNIAFTTFKDQVIFERDEITKEDGKLYVVFTPYSKRWMAQFAKHNIEYFASERKLDNTIEHDYPFLTLHDIGFTKSKIKVSQFDISKKVIADYEQTRNFPAVDQTSHLSPYLRFGAVSVRKIVAMAYDSNNLTFLKELIWREFFMQILWYFPETITKSFRPKYENIKWRCAENDFKKWCDGQTGYPIVDAGMRQLNETGGMHNRVRMVVASFLCKHLLIDWRWGEAYFAEKLLDYEQSSNVGNWQWAAGSGVDAAPYFRIFNPAEQQKKFDKDLKYIKKWVPEAGTEKYPAPIVDHKEARERCLKVYKDAVG
jgi:deoxyribodipyrimidine photo-lyase